MKTLVTALGFIVSLSGALIATWLANEMRRDVNGQLPPDQRYSFWTRYPGKSFIIMNHYRRLFPDGELCWTFCYSLGSSLIGVVILAFGLALN